MTRKIVYLYLKALIVAIVVNIVLQLVSDPAVPQQIQSEPADDKAHIINQEDR